MHDNAEDTNSPGDGTQLESPPAVGARNDAPEIVLMPPSNLIENEINGAVFMGPPFGQYESLKADIGKRGIIYPIVVTSQLKILAGHLRRRAALALGLDVVPVIVREDLDDVEDQREFLLVDNLNSRSLSPMELSNIINQLWDICKGRQGRAEQTDPELRGKTRDIVARQVGVSPKQAEKLRKFQQLEEKDKIHLHTGEISQAEALRRLKSKGNPTSSANVLAKFLARFARLHMTYTQDLLIELKAAGEELDISRSVVDGLVQSHRQALEIFQSINAPAATFTPPSNDHVQSEEGEDNG